MQRQAKLPEFFDQIAKNTNPQFDFPRLTPLKIEI